MIDLHPPDTGRAALPESAARPVGPRRTAQRAEVQRALAHSDGFVSAQALHAAMIAGGSRVGLTTVYRALAALVEGGSADTVREPNGTGRGRSTATI